MGRRMTRGKQQVLLNYLPGKTFDFEKIGTIARVERIRGVPRPDLNLHLILRSIEQQAHGWSEEHRPLFRDIDRNTDRFVLIEPRGVEASMFPLVFWCQNPKCGVVVQMRDSVPTSENCATCRRGRLVQLRFVKVHRCGNLEALGGRQCNACNAKGLMALDTRGSERFSEFQWVCRSCAATSPVFGGRCRACNWPGVDPAAKNMAIEVHRAGRTFYPHYTVLLNQPGRELNAFLNVPHWQAIAAGAFLGMPEIRGRRLTEFVADARSDASTATFTLTQDERSRLRSQGLSEDTIAQFERMQAELQVTRSQERDVDSPAAVSDALVARSGVEWAAWERAGQEFLEAMMPVENGAVTRLVGGGAGTVDMKGRDAAKRIGLAEVTLATDFPMTTATYGYSRGDYRPDTCRLNPFPADADHGGRFPIFVDVVQADAVLLRLDHASVLHWLALNGVNVILPDGNDPDLCARGYFVRLFDGVALTQTVQGRETRLVFGLLHTLSHLALRRAALLCGLESTSLSEYVLPKTLTCALYSNHRFGATIGALSALFEQSLSEWLSEIRHHRMCVYDPVCIERGGACHACSHLAETSCRFFNLNLGRPFLFGGRDEVAGAVPVGFIDAVSRQ